MKHNVVAPSVGESITEVSILKWLKSNGQQVRNGEVLLEIESDKATVEVAAEATGALTILKQAGERMTVGSVIGMIDDAVTGSVGAEPAKVSATAAAPAAVAAAPAQPTSTGARPSGSQASGPALTQMAAGPGSSPVRSHAAGATAAGMATTTTQVARHAPAQPAGPQYVDQPGDRRVPMSMLRQRIAERLKYAQDTAAILTTFNEVDMTAVMALRNKHKDDFKSKHGVPLSFMSFFTRASVEALKAIPDVNASIDGKDVIFHDYCDIGIAVGTDRGLVVPVIRGADKMGFVDIEKKMAELATKARDGKLGIADLAGGTFTISNGGTYGSLLSTPILNPPQSGILGMHKIQERPVAVNGKVEIRPMMYLALSYDHRIVDGKGAVTFLVQLREFLENPEKLKFSM
ncbi:2-oxoglutarate dehydrogenase complex dihydrolipoyllysine-residue succinyltransferase [bacterium]|nr:2-oxoglutarate dehydrogenase complex dihydrolipoyllysine-residue succinyltransferase [bacterium]